MTRSVDPQYSGQKKGQKKGIKKDKKKEHMVPSA